MDNFRYDPYLRLYIDFSKHDVQTGESFMSDDAHGHLCTATGGAWRLDGRAFDGDDLVSCGADSSLDCNSGITLLSWVKVDALGVYEALFDKRDGSGGYSLRLRGDTNELDFELRDSGGTYDFVRGNISLTNTDYFFCGATFDGDVMKVFANGVEIASKDTPRTNIGTNAKALRIGRGPDNFWAEMTVSKAWIYSRPYSILEIQDVYEQTRGKRQ